MPKGSVPKREAKKPKKSTKREALAASPTSPVFSSTEVEVVRKRKKRKEEEDI